ncbi:MAG: hypothetical protein RLZZ15_1903 [Verrucomicrobiota bacterium]|jgi:ABC-type transport system involved in multi-copper enzyme maturation permease subunit
MTPAPAADPDSTPSAAARSDFPTWLPPMFVKELRQGLRTRGFVGAFVVFQIIMALTLVGTVASAWSSSGGGVPSNAATNGFFWTLLTIQLLLVTPARALGSLKTEIDSRSLDLLLLTRLTAWRIVAGKWLSLVAQAGLLLVAMAPYGIVRYFTGSVDLVADAGHGALLFGGCAVATALCLWASGIPRVLQVVITIAVVFGNQLFNVMGRGVSVFFGAMDAMLWTFDGALALVFFLTASVRRIAPLAENHALLARGLPLLALAPVGIWGAWVTPRAGLAQWVFAGFFLALVCAVELIDARAPRAAHWQAWAKHGPLARCVGRLFLPGWPSALAFAVVAALGLCIALWLVPGLPATEAARLPWLVVLGLGALVFPVVIMALFEGVSARAPGLWFIAIFGALSLLAALAAGADAMFGKGYVALKGLASVLPVSSFWLSLGESNLSTPERVGQGAMVAVLVFAAWAQSRPYWRGVTLLGTRGRLGKP